MAAVSVELLPDGPVADVLAAIEAADAAGLNTAFLVDEIYHRDAWMLLAPRQRARVGFDSRLGSRM